mgnify:CR=1 FL=1
MSSIIVADYNADITNNKSTDLNISKENINNIEVVYDCRRLLVYVNGNLVAENYNSNDVSVKIDL